MGDPYAGGTPYANATPSGSYSSGSPYASATPGLPAKPKGHHGIGGFLQNLGSDAVSAVEGAGPALATIASIPANQAVETYRLATGDTKGAKKSAKAASTAAHQFGTGIVESYAQTYGPLTHGDVAGFLHQLYSHPLGPILDVATLLTGGAGAAAKAGILSDRAALLELRAPNGLATSRSRRHGTR